MGSSNRAGLQLSDTDSSDMEDLPVFDFSQYKSSQAPKEDPVVLDGSDSEVVPLSSLVLAESCSPAVAAGGDVHVVSSDSEEETFIPLAVRLKQKQGGFSVATAATDREKDTKARCVSTHQSSSSNGTASKPRHASSAEQSAEHKGISGECETQNRMYPVTDAPSGGEIGTYPAKRKRGPAEIVASREEALRRRAERDRLQGERERMRAEKKALFEAVKALRPEECIKHMVVTVDPALLQLEGGGALLTSLQSLGCGCVIEKQPLPRSVSWTRRSPSPQTGELLSVLESHTLVHVPVEDFMSMVHSSTQEQRGEIIDCTPSLTAWTSRLLDRNAGARLNLVVIDIEKYFKSQKAKTQKRLREAVLGEGQGSNPQGGGRVKKRRDGGEKLPNISRVELEEALVDLQLQTGVQVRFLSTWKDFSDYVAMSTKAVAEAPFKREREKTGFGFCVESEWAGGHRVERSGKGLVQVWKRQMQQLNRVSPDMATAIVSNYPSPQALVQAYAWCKSEREKISLLADVLIRRGEGVTSTTRRVGPELSKRLFLLMTSSDPEQVLDSAV
ncbi:crossover junction endonuclease EME1 [Chanos chanos]|uniref:Crossover junction endonuclease EME1 n=1 Tax=Chanos chanos TaxID=29144 RepID=A0A6J2VG71_CHACN|nr:crossover junction endonuclease EME1 [Chanos chanos]